MLSYPHILEYIPRRHSFDFLFSRLCAVVGDPPSESTLAKCCSLCLATSAEEYSSTFLELAWQASSFMCFYFNVSTVVVHCPVTEKQQNYNGSCWQRSDGQTWLDLARGMRRSPWKVAAGRESKNNKTVHFCAML